jgi:hypothetical protein
MTDPNLERLALIEKIAKKKIDHWRIEGEEYVVIFTDFSKQRFPLSYNPMIIEPEPEEKPKKPAAAFKPRGRLPGRK